MGAAQEYLPSMPSFGGKKQTRKPDTTSEKAVDTATQAATGMQKGVTGAAGAAKDVIQPSVNNTLNPADNPVVKSAKDTAKKAPIIHQASDRIPGANKAAQVTSDTVGITVQNTGQTVSGALNTTASKTTDAGTAGAGRAVEAGKGAASTATNAASTGTGSLTDAGKLVTGQNTALRETDKSPSQQKSQQQQAQSYFSRAAGYLPATSSLPSMPSFGGNKRGPPKLAKQNSGTGGAQSPKPQPHRTPPGVKSPPKLDRMPSAGAKSPLQRTSSGMKSPPPKLEKKASGTQSPRPLKLERSPSGLKSPPKLERATSGLNKEVTNAPQKAGEGADAVRKQAGDGAEAAKKQAGSWTDTATGAVGGVTSRLPVFGDGK